MITWVIQLKPEHQPHPTYYGENGEGVLGWTSDIVGSAVRFAREQDAQLVIDCEGFTEAFASQQDFDPIEPEYS
jgi:hypothetical protein